MTEKTTTAKQLVSRYAQVAEAMTALLSGFAEIVIHDIATQKIVHIANNISKRQLGDASALDEVTFEDDENLIGPYEKLNWDGQKIRSISVVLRDDDSTPIGMMCINMKISAFESAKAMLDMLLSGYQVTSQPEKLFQDDWQERINIFVNDWLKQHHLSIDVLTYANKRELVHALYQEGAFSGKSASDYIANVLNMGRATVFKYLAEVKNK